MNCAMINLLSQEDFCMNTLLNSGTPDIIGYVSTLINVFFAILVLFSVFKGYRRGIVRQSIRTATIVISVAVAIFIIKNFVGEITTACEGNTVAEAIESLGGGALLDSVETETLEMLKTLDAEKITNIILVPTASLVFPLVFTVLFIIISAVLYIIYGIVCIFVRGLRKKNNTGKTRLFGAILGLVQGFIVATIFFLPVANVLDIADSAVEAIRDTESEESTELLDVYDEYASPLYNFPLKTSMTLGGRFLANTVATIEIEGESYNTRTPIPLFADIYNDILKLKGAEFDKLTKSQQQIVRDIEKKIFEDRFFKSSVAGLLSEMGKIMEDELEGEEDAQTAELYDAFLSIFKNSTADTVEDDFDTLLDVLFFMTNEGVTEAMSGDDTDAITDALTKTVVYNGKSATVIKHIIDMLDENPHTKPIVTTLTKLSLTVMAEQLDFGVELDGIYEEISTDVEALNDCNTEADVKDTIDGIFSEHNIELDDEILNGMTDYVYSEYTANGKEITESDVNDIIFSYYDAFVAAGY